MRIDLHLHTNASDGELEPDALVREAAAGRLDVIAVTDHDTAAGVARAAAAAPAGVRVIPGIEVSSTHAGAELHILGYFIDPNHPALAAHSRNALERREERMRGMIRRLEALGHPVSYDEVRSAAGSEGAAMGRPHLARALVRRGHVQSFGEAFARFLADGGPAFLPTDLLTPREAVELIHLAGGFAVWAHPRIDLFDAEIRRFADWGLDGVECFRPRTPPSESFLLETAARDLGLLVTGGSDWHGAWHGRLGEFALRREDVSDILELGGI